MNTSGPNRREARFAPLRNEQTTEQILDLARSYAADAIASDDPNEKEEAIEEFWRLITMADIPDELTKQTIDQARFIAGPEPFGFASFVSASNHPNLERRARSSREETISQILGLAENYAVDVISADDPKEKAKASSKFWNFVGEYGFPEELTQRTIDKAQRKTGIEALEFPSFTASNHSKFQKLAYNPAEDPDRYHDDPEHYGIPGSGLKIRPRWQSDIEDANPPGEFPREALKTEIKELLTMHPEQQLKKMDQIWSIGREFGLSDEKTAEIFRELFLDLGATAEQTEQFTKFAQAQYDMSGSEVVHQDDQILILQNPSGTLELFERSGGWQPHTIRIGDKGYQFKRNIEPEEASILMEMKPETPEDAPIPTPQSENWNPWEGDLPAKDMTFEDDIMNGRLSNVKKDGSTKLAQFNDEILMRLLREQNVDELSRSEFEEDFPPELAQDLIDQFDDLLSTFPEDLRPTIAQWIASGHTGEGPSEDELFEILNQRYPNADPETIDAIISYTLNHMGRRTQEMLDSFQQRRHNFDWNEHLNPSPDPDRYHDDPDLFSGPPGTSLGPK